MILNTLIISVDRVLGYVAYTSTYNTHVYVAVYIIYTMHNMYSKIILCYIILLYKILC